MLALYIILLVVGLIALVRASDVFVDAASSFATKMRVPKMLIALTIAAFGTCAPELAISFTSIASHNVDMTLANVIGSCIVNILLIVGVATIVKPIAVKERTVKRELPMLVVVTGAFFVMLNDSIFTGHRNGLTRADALILMILFAVFMLYILLVVRSHHAVALAEAIGISQKIVAMTAIVIGTSLPELTMTVGASRKGEFDLAVGNIIGTNIFNICIVLGLPTLIFGGFESSAFGLVDTVVVLLAAVAYYIFGRSNKRLTRMEGVIMVLIFLMYYAYVLLI